MRYTWDLYERVFKLERQVSRLEEAIYADYATQRSYPAADFSADFRSGSGALWPDFSKKSTKKKKTSKSATKRILEKERK